MVTATLVKELHDWKGDARLYRLSEPVLYGWDSEGTTNHVVISAVVAYSGPETYIFPADPDGETLSMMELDGSYQGGLDHAAAIAGAGWTLDG